MILIDAEGLTMSRPDRPLFTDVSVTVRHGDRLGIVGINGGGKSTLARVLVGRETPEAGTVRRARDVRIGFLDQTSPLPAGLVREVVGNSWQAKAIADRLGVTPLFDAATDRLSGGEAKRVALAKVLAEECDLLVLDEPTNHLDIDAIAWLERFLADFRGGLILITHDRFVLDATTTRVLELDRGRAYVHDGGYASYLEHQLVRAEHAAAAEAVRQNLVRRELAWLRRKAPARTSKQKARIDRAHALIDTKAERVARPEPLDLGGDEFATPRLGDLVIELTDVTQRFGDGPPLFEGLTLALDRRERLGIVGPNGSGKSTALDLIAGLAAPSGGTRVAGPTVQLGYYDQRGMPLETGKTVREVVVGEKREMDWRDKRLLERFWFDDDAQRAPIELLSGGERRRLQLLLLLLARPNVLLLDEPTNDLDIDTLRALEDYLDDWPGAMVVVSHDRAFLERTCDDFIAFERGQVPGPIAGGLPAWLEGRGTGARTLRATTEPDTPTPRKEAKESKSKTASPSTLRNRIRTVEREMQPLSARRDELEALLSGGAADHRTLEEAAAELATVSGRLDELENQWLDLAAELEAMGALP